MQTLFILLSGVYAYPEVTKNRGNLNVEVNVNNHSDKNEKVVVVNELFDNTGKSVGKNRKTISVAGGKDSKVETKLTVSKPALWSIDNPNLYTLKTTVLLNGKEIDSSETKTGFRTYTFDPNKGFALNGEWMKVKGVCIHHDAGVLGSAVPKDVWKRRLENLKSTSTCFI